MKIISSITVTDAVLTTNIPITETLWTAGTYATGVQRYEGHLLYEVIATPSTTDQPSVGAAATPATWKVLQAINRWLMFDGKANSQSTKATPIDVTVNLPNIVNAVSVLNMSAKTLILTVTDGVDGEVYRREVELIDNSVVVDWWTFFFAPYSQIYDVVFTDLPAYTSADIRMQLTAPTGNVACGELVLGTTREIGNTQFGTSVGMTDYSRKQADDFGNYSIEQRAFSKRVEYNIQVETKDVPGIFKFLTSLRATPSVFVGDDGFEATIVYGFYKDFDILISNPALSICNLSVEGL
jgi:hypothetical protein